MLTWIGNDQSMKMRGTSRAIGKKLSVNNNVGRALKFYSSVRLDVRRTETVKESGEAVSNKVKIKIVKNKVAPPFKEALVTIKFGQGLDLDSELIDISIKNGEIIKSGSWFSLKSGERIGQGVENAKKYIAGQPELRERLLAIARNQAEINTSTETVESANNSIVSETEIELNDDIIDE
jgi:recombination protein RecA